MSLTLQIGGASAVELSTLGITAATLTTNHQGLDSLTLATNRRLSDSALIAAFTKCILREGSTIRFIGWLDQAPRAAAPAQTLTYILAGPWRWLTRAYYLDDKTIEAEALADASGLYRLGAKLTDGSDDHIAVATQLLDILNFARTDSSNAFNIATFPEGFFNIEIPWESRVDDLCSSAAAALLSYTPTAAAWWTYPAGIPTLNFADTAGAAASQTLTTGTIGTVPTLNPRYDLLRDTVKIIYLQQNASGENTRTVRTVASAGDAATLGAAMAQLYTFALQENEPLPDTGLENALAAWHQRLHIETSAQYRGLDWTRLAGEAWTFAGPFAEWAGKLAICQTITRDLFARTETITLGPPAAPSTYRLTKRSTPGPSSEPEPPTGTLTIAITGLPSGLISDAKWSVGEMSGAGAGEIELPPGTYNVEFLPVYDFDAQSLYFSPPVEVEITDGGTATATAVYEEIPLEPVFEIGTVTTLDAGSSATAELTKTDGVWQLDLGIPRGTDGEDGEDGADSTVPGPKGDKGDQGDTPTSATAECNEEGGIDITFS